MAVGIDYCIYAKKQQEQILEKNDTVNTQWSDMSLVRQPIGPTIIT